jgi:hypothetical protein
VVLDVIKAAVIRQPIEQLANRLFRGHVTTLTSSGYGVFHMYVVSAFRRTMPVRLKPDTTYM